MSYEPNRLKILLALLRALYSLFIKEASIIVLAGVTITRNVGVPCIARHPYLWIIL